MNSAIMVKPQLSINIQQSGIDNPLSSLHQSDMSLNSMSGTGQSVSPSVDEWIQQGDVAKLEQMVLTGQGWQLVGKQAMHARAKAFLNALPAYMASVEQFLIAAVHGNVSQLKELKSYRKTVWARHPVTGASALHLVCIFARSDALRFLARGVDQALLNAQDRDGRTAAHYAALIAANLHTSTYYDVLAASGCDVHLPDAEGFTAFQYLSEHNVVELEVLQKMNMLPVAEQDDVDLMIQRGDMAAIEDMVYHGHHWIPVDRLFPPGREHLRRRISQAVRRVYAIHQSIMDGDTALFMQLVDRPALALCRLPFGCTPLHTAVHAKRYSMAEYLTLLYPDVVEYNDKRDRSALHYAAFLPPPVPPSSAPDESGYGYSIAKDNGDDEASYDPQAFYKLLLRAGVDSAQTDDESHTADYYNQRPQLAAEIHKEISQLYVKHREPPTAMEPVNTASTGGNTGGSVSSVSSMPSESELRACLERGDTSLLEKLMADGREWYVQQWAKRHQPVAKFLQVHKQTQDGRTGLHYAAWLAAGEHGNSKIYDHMVERGADVNLPDTLGHTPVQYRSDISLIPLSASADASSALHQHIMSGEVARAVNGTNGVDEDTDDREHEPSDSDVDAWLAEGDVDALERLVLDGRGHLLADKSADNDRAREFLRALAQYQQKIDAIHKAVEEGDGPGLPPQTDMLRFLTRKFPGTVNSIDRRGRTPLHFAAADRNGANLVRLLQRAGADAFVEDKNGHTPFYYRTNPGALKLDLAKDSAIIDQLLQGDIARPLLQDLEEDIADWLATGNVGKLEELVLNGYGDLLLGRIHDVENADVIDFIEILPQYQNKRTPLHFAAALQDGGGMYRLLRRAGAHPDIIDCYGHAPKYYLNHAGELDLVSLRLDKKTALQRALHNRVAPSYLESNIQQWLREGNVGKLEQLVLSGCGDMLLEKETNSADCQLFLDNLPEYLDKIDQVHRAARTGDLEAFRSLANSRKLVVSRDRKGATPLHDAVLYGSTEIVRYVAQNHPQVLNSVDYNKRTPLHYAAASRDGGHYYKILERAGADPKAVDNEGHTAEYYLRNVGILDLKTIRDRDTDSVTGELRELADANEDEEFAPGVWQEDGKKDSQGVKNRGHDSAVSAGESVSAASAIDDEDLYETEGVSLLVSGGAGSDNTVSLRASREAFEQALMERIGDAQVRYEQAAAGVAGQQQVPPPPPVTEHGLYLARTVGPALTKALAELIIRRPADPVDFISRALYQYHSENGQLNGNGAKEPDQENGKQSGSN